MAKHLTEFAIGRAVLTATIMHWTVTSSVISVCYEAIFTLSNDLIIFTIFTITACIFFYSLSVSF